MEQFCRFRGLDLAEYVEINEGEDIWEFLDEIWRTMKRSVEEGLMTEGMLPGGLKVERKAKMLFEHPAAQRGAPGAGVPHRLGLRFAVSEQNADCGTIVTAPTCGACGVLPASLVYVQQQRHLSDERVLRGLAVAGLIGNLIKRNRSISGASAAARPRSAPPAPWLPPPSPTSSASRPIRSSTRRDRTGAPPGAHLRPHLRIGAGSLHRAQRRGRHARHELV